MNLGCDIAQLVSAIPSDDAGTFNVANTLFSFPPDFVNPVVGYGVEVNATDAHVPPAGTVLILGSEVCIQLCQKQGKMVKRTQWAG